MTARTCRALQQTHIRSFKEFLDILFEPESPRCGAPAVKDTMLGPMCQACYDRIEESRKNRTNLLGVAQEFFNPPPTGPHRAKKEDS